LNAEQKKKVGRKELVKYIIKKYKYVNTYIEIQLKIISMIVSYLSREIICESILHHHHLTIQEMNQSPKTKTIDDTISI